MAYTDLAGREEHLRWFEIQARRGLTGEWFIAGVLREEPDRVRNLPPGAVNPFVSGSEIVRCGAIVTRQPRDRVPA